MAVLVEGISVIVRRDSIASKYRGGWEAFLRNGANSTLCFDDAIARVGFMSPEGMQAYLAQLEAKGLQFVDHEKALDVAIADQQKGLTVRCDWLEFARFNIDGDQNKKVGVCWFFDGPRVASGIHLQDTSFDIATPAGWTFEKSLSDKFTYIEPENILVNAQRQLDVNTAALRTPTNVHAQDPGAVARARESLNEWEARISTSDPNWQAKKAILVAVLPGAFKRLDPSLWTSTFEQAYKNLPANAFDKSNATPPPVSQQNLRNAVIQNKAREDLNAFEERMKSEDPNYEAKYAMLAPAIRPVLEKIDPSLWVETFEAAYSSLPASVVLTQAGSTNLQHTYVVDTSRGTGEVKKESPPGSMTVLLYELSSHPGEVGVSKVDPPVADGAFFLDFSRPLRVTRQCFGISNDWIGKATDLSVPIAHHCEGTGQYIIHVHWTDPRFAHLRALWKARHPSPRAKPPVIVGGLKIIADFGTQFPQGC